MSKLKGTIKALEVGGGECMHRSWTFVFSDDILDWRFSDTQLGKVRRKKYEAEMKAKLTVSKGGNKSQHSKAA
jgi:hypothetical protein